MRLFLSRIFKSVLKIPVSFYLWTVGIDDFGYNVDATQLCLANVVLLSRFFLVQYNIQLHAKRILGSLHEKVTIGRRKHFNISATRCDSLLIPDLNSLLVTNVDVPFPVKYGMPLLVMSYIHLNTSI